MIIDVVARCRNEMPFTERMLDGLLRQTGVRARILFMDCGSTDGSREAAASRALRIEDVEPSAYVPGVVLNRGMELTSSDVVAFINADCIPLEDTALGDLVAPLVAGGSIAATYARQMPRPDADPLVRLEYARAFAASGPPRLRNGAFFSMAASAIRRSAWEALPFDPTLRFSEDVDWKNRIRALGGGIEYVPSSRFEHSHNYDARGQFTRRRGEGKADAQIHRLGPPSVVRDLVRPLGGALVRDARSNQLSPRGLFIRGAQAMGYFAGRREAARDSGAR